MIEKLVDSNLHELTTHGSKDFPCALYSDTYQIYGNRFYYTHFHEEIEILISYKGAVDVEVNGNIYHMDDRDILFINSNCLHNILHNNYPDSYIIPVVANLSQFGSNAGSFIDREIISEVLNKQFDALIIKDESLYQDFISLRGEVRSKAKGYQLDMLITLLKTINYIYKHFEDIKTKDNHSLDSQRIRNGLNYIYTNYSNNVTVNDISKAVGLSSGETSRLFKKVLGKAPIDYLLHYRINLANVLLKKSDKSITEIALDVGFSSSNYFTIAFKKVFGITPKQARNQR